MKRLFLTAEIALVLCVVGTVFYATFASGQSANRPAYDTLASVRKVLSAASTNAVLVQGGKTTLYGVSVVNTNAASAFLKFYNGGSAPTCASDTVVMTLALVQNVPVNLTLGGVNFGTGLGLCITANAADNDNANATTGITLNVIYR